MQKSNFQSMKKIMPRVLQTHGIGLQLEARHILAVAEESLKRIWGAERAAYAQMASFRDGTLTVHLKSSAALHTIKMQEAQFMNEINRTIGERRVLQIRYTT